MRWSEWRLLALAVVGSLILGAGAHRLADGPSAPPRSPAAARSQPLRLSKISLPTRLHPLTIPSYPRQSAMAKATGDTGSSSGSRSETTDTSSSATPVANTTQPNTATKTSSKKASTTSKTHTHQPSIDPLDDGGGTLGG